MFITRFAPIFFDADDGGGGEAPSFADARAEFLSNPPAIEEIPEPVETPEVDPLDAPELADLGTPAPTPEPAVEGVDPYAEFGGREAVEKALQLDAAMRTESGIRLVVAQSLQALGYTPQQIRAALEGQPVPGGIPAGEPEPEPDPLVDIADDDYVSGGDLKRIVAKAVEKAAQQAAEAVQGALEPTVDAFQQQRQAQAAAVADAAYAEVIGELPENPSKEQVDEWNAEQAAVLAQARRFIQPDDWNPQNIRAAILRGGEALRVQREADLARYVAKKRAAREANPTNVGGGQPPGGEAPREPKTLAEAREMAQAQGYFN